MTFLRFKASQSEHLRLTTKHNPRPLGMRTRSLMPQTVSGTSSWTVCQGTLVLGISSSHLACPLAPVSSLWGQEERNWISEKGSHLLISFVRHDGLLTQTNYTGAILSLSHLKFLLQLFHNSSKKSDQGRRQQWEPSIETKYYNSLKRLSSANGYNLELECALPCTVISGNSGSWYMCTHGTDGY